MVYIGLYDGESVFTYFAVQRQKAVSAYFTSKQILPFVFAEQYLPPPGRLCFSS